jgi:hypothetical protein
METTVTPAGSTPELTPELTPKLTPESTPDSTPVLTPGLTPDNTLGHTYIGIFTSMEGNLKCKKKGVRNYVTADIPTWTIDENIDISSFSKYGCTPKNNYLLNPILGLQNFADDEWLLCPIQSKEKEIGWDIQIGMSGKCKQGQNEFDGMLLELEEELGLKYIGEDRVAQIITNHKGKWYDGRYTREYSYTRTTFKIHFNDVRLINTDVDKPIGSVSDEENYYKTIACLVYGKITDIKKVLDIKKVNYSCNDDRVIGMAYVSGKTIKRILKTFS